MNSIFKNKTQFIGIILLALFFNTSVSKAQSKTFQVKNFDKVIVSPHIEVVFKTGDKEEVIIESITEPMQKLNVEVKNKTLQLYLDGAQIATKKDKINSTEYKTVPLYKGTVVKATIIYKKVKTFSLRGEERFVFNSPIISNKLTLRIYGESQVYMNDVTLKDLRVAIYGESFLKIESGSIESQRITAYGESTVNTLEANNKSTKITAYGDGSFQFNVSENLKVVSYGEPTVTYKGSATLENGLSFGEAEIVKLN